MYGPLTRFYEPVARSLPDQDRRVADLDETQPWSSAAPPGRRRTPGSNDGYRTPDQPSCLIAYSGSGHSCELARAGTAKCWGDDNPGQLGDGALSPPLVH